MPSPTFIKQLALSKFSGYQIKLPPVGTGGVVKLAGSTAGAMAAKPAMAPAMRAGAGINVPSVGRAAPPPPQTAPTMTCPPALFVAASNSVADAANQKAEHETYTAVIEGLIDATKYAWDMYRLQAKFTNIKIMAVGATGAPGCLDGPSMEPLIKTAPKVMSWTGALAGIRDAYAAGFQNSWKQWEDKVVVPGLPWYPAFAAFPAPMAPPMPNVPTPLIACPSAGLAAMGPIQLKTNLAEKLNGKMEYHSQFADAMAVMIAPAFTTWLASQMIVNVMGKGPVPSFAPPYVPVGPVVGGDVISAPGHLST